MENPDFLSTQLITYIGNKRALLQQISEAVRFCCARLNKEKCVTADIFSGSGSVARLLKQFSSELYANDLEAYSALINRCYLSNISDFDAALWNDFAQKLERLAEEKPFEGIISQNYAPHNDNLITKDTRLFYTRENALFIDSCRHYIDEIGIPEDFKKFFLAPLLTEASVHVNTSGVFKGFYKDPETGIGTFGGAGKNALSRIMGKIRLKAPVLSNYQCPVFVSQCRAEDLCSSLPALDIAYLDPPYNQHPYGSNYFMLNVILENRLEENISKVSGIPANWNRSAFNRRTEALSSLEKVIRSLNARFIIISYNSEGFITFEQMIRMLEQFGTIRTEEITYSAFKGSRNLANRNLNVKEFLFILEKQL